jgi:hypothetical protein
VGGGTRRSPSVYAGLFSLQARNPRRENGADDGRFDAGEGWRKGGRRKYTGEYRSVYGRVGMCKAG